MASGDLGTLTLVLTADDKGFNAAIKNADGTMKNLAKSVEDKGVSITKTMGNAFDNVAGSFMNFRTLIAGAGIVAGLKSALDFTSEFQQNRIALDTMLQSGDKAKQMMIDLTNFAKNTPFNLPQVVDGAKSLLAYGIEADKIIPTFNALGNIASGVGRDKLPQLVLAFGQVRTAQKLYGTELRQFTEAGVPLLDMLAKQSGKSAASIKADMEKGVGPSFTEVEKAIMGMTSEGGQFFNLMQKQSQTFSGRMSNIQDSVQGVARKMLGLTDVGEVVKGSFFDRISNAALGFMNYLEKNSDKIAKYGAAFLDNLVPALGALAAAFVVAKTMAVGFAIAAAGAAIIPTLIALGIAAVVAAIVFLQIKFNIFGKAADFIKAQWEALTGFFADVAKNIGSFISDMRKKYEDAIAKMSKLTDEVMGNIKKKWDEYKDAIYTTTGVLVTIFAPKLIQIGALAIKAAIKHTISAAIVGVQWTIAAIKSSAAWVAETAKMMAKAVATAAVMAAQAIASGAVWIAGAVATGAVWIAQFALMAAKAVFTAGVMTVQAAVSGYVWVFQAGKSIVAWLIAFPAMAAGAIATAVTYVVQATIGAGAWIAGAVRTAVVWLISFPAMAGGAIATAAVFVAQNAIATGAWIAGAVATLVGWAVSFAVMIAGAIATGAAMLVAGAQAAFAWLMALGPIGWVIAAIIAVIAIVALVIANWKTIGTFFHDLFSNIGKVVFDTVGNIIKWFQDLNLFDSGAKLLASFGDGIKSAVGAAVKAAKSAVEAVANLFPHSPAKEGPFSGRGYTTHSGRALIRDFADSITAQASYLNSSIAGVMAGASGSLALGTPAFNTGNVSANDLYGGSTASGGGLGSINQTVYASTDVDMQLINEDLMRRARRAR